MLKRDNEMKSTQILNENRILKGELEKIKQVKGQNFTISKCMLKYNHIFKVKLICFFFFTVSSNETLLNKVSKLNEENIELKKQLENLKDDSPK